MQKMNAFHNCQDGENKEGEIPQEEESKETEDTAQDPGASGRHQGVKQETQVTAKEGGLNVQGKVTLPLPLFFFVVVC